MVWAAGSSSEAKIAAICRLVDAALTTRNAKDFAETGVELVNPGSDPRTGLWILSQGLGGLAIRLGR
jgi:hypothetical protein